MSEIIVWLLHPATGQPLAMLDEYGVLEYTKVVNGVGAFSIEVPSTFDFSLFQEDTRIAIQRKPDGGTKALDFVGFVRYVERAVKTGQMYRTIAGPCLNDLLRRRIIAYAATTAESQQSNDHADDIMKVFVRQNLGVDAIAARNISASGFTVQAYNSLGTLVSKAAAWRNLLDVLKEVSDDSHSTESTCAYFGIVPLNNGWECEFRTNIGQWGMDHRFPSGPAGPVIFSLDFGNIDSVSRSTNYREEVTFAYAGGQGEGTTRNIQTATDAARVGMSPFNRCEGFADARNGTTNAYVLAEAQVKLRDGRPRKSFSGSIVASGVSQVYGRDYGHGDYVTAVFEGETIDCRIESVRVQVADSQETVEAILKSEL